MTCNEALIKAADEGKLDEVKELCNSAGVDLNVITNSFVTAARKGHLEIVEYLYEKLDQKGGDVNVIEDSTGRTVLDVAVASQELKVVNFLLTKNPILKKHKDYNDNAFLLAVTLPNSEVVKRLIDYHPSLVNDPSRDAMPLAIAAYNGRVKIVALLIEHGAQLEGQRSFRVGHILPVPIIEAAKRGHREVIEVLLTAGAAIDMQDRYGRNALHYAVINRQLEIVRYLVEKGININQIDAWGGETPLMLANRIRSKDDNASSDGVLKEIITYLEECAYKKGYSPLRPLSL